MLQWILLLSYLLVMGMMLFLALWIVLADMCVLYPAKHPLQLLKQLSYFLVSGYVSMVCPVRLLVTVTPAFRAFFGNL